MKPFEIHLPRGHRVPILLSIPHCGAIFPPELQGSFKPDLLTTLDDTDWFVNRLYDFAPDLGITMITGVYHRWVIDLNRDPDDKPLYTDGRIITGLCPVTDFLGAPLYQDNRDLIEPAEVERRKHFYYEPYHRMVADLISELKNEFGKVFLWDCHSIRQYVETIYRDKIPDLILGDADGASASPNAIELVFKLLNASSYSLSHNFPFKGGHITRTYGRPLENQQALQLEMTKINYMDDGETHYDHSRAEKVRHVLRQTLTALADSLMTKV